MPNRRSVYPMVLLLYFCIALLGLTADNVVPEISAETNNQSAIGASGQIYLPSIYFPSSVVNTTVDGADWNPGDGRCETAPGNNICTLRAQIQETNAQSGPDTIVLAPGQYNLTITGVNEDNAATGDLDILDELTIIGQDPATTIINGNQIDRVFHVHGEKSTLSNLTILNGQTIGQYEDGGAISNDWDNTLYAGPMTLDNLIITNNTVLNANGGAIFTYGPMTISNSSLSGNVSAGGGGAINSRYETLSVTDTIIQNNTARSGGGIMADHILITNSLIDSNIIIDGGPFKEGGGLWILVSATINNSTISNHTFTNGQGGGIFIGRPATVMINNSRIESNSVIGNSSFNQGGGIYSESSQVVTIVDTTIKGNFSDEDGGGLYHLGAQGPGTLNLNRVAILQNTTKVRGAGIYTSDTMNMTNVTVSGNQMIGSENRQGGGIYVNQGTASITNSTIANNLAYSGGAIYNDFSTITLQNTILANNMIISGGDATTHNCYGPINSGGYNLEDGVNCNLSSSGDLNGINPLLLSLTTSSAWPPVHPLSPSSPAIDSGNNAVCPSVDQRGAVRPYDGNGNGTAICDIGAFEFP